MPCLHPMYCAFYKILSAACDGSAKGKAHVLGLGAPDELRLLSDLDLLINVLSTPGLRVRRMQPSTPPGTVFVVSDASFWGWCFRITFGEGDDRPPAIVHGQWTVTEVERFMWLIRSDPFDGEADWTAMWLNTCPSSSPCWPSRTGGSFLGIIKRARMGLTLANGGAPVASSIAVAPKDQMSAALS